jgi:hypothetical protein
MSDDNEIRSKRRAAYKMAIEVVALRHPDELGQVYSDIQKTLGIVETKETEDVADTE